MIFNSFEFIFLFLPIVFILYFVLNKINFVASKVFLLLSSLFFYGYWNPKYVPLVVGSLIVNFTIGTYLGKENRKYRKSILTVGIVFNVALLSFFKYYDFFVRSVNSVVPTGLPLLNIVLPLAISFYTFQQIAYLVDSYRFETKNYKFYNYCLFVTFFPHLIAGPLVQHSDVMKQFEDRSKRNINYRNIAMGLFIFSIGMFKKVGIADHFAIWANQGYSMTESLTFIDAWFTSLAYTLQLYFDFSGYSDMAIGAGLLLNIALPRNFNSPYKALNIQDFWRRWHITLSNFLTRYIYIPLGGNRKGNVRTYVNILIIFFISGLWHGAGWTFIIWGLLHGFASVINRLWQKAGFAMNKWLAWFITFMFVNATWVFFRAPTFGEAKNVFKGMLGLNGFALPKQVQKAFHLSADIPVYAFKLAPSFLTAALALLAAFIIAVTAKNSLELRDDLKPNTFNAVFCSALLIYCIFQFQKVSTFLYFNF
ncbi:MBOAT family O-acyltransferase [Bacillus testis]|uniref:MBOAT family O-acyltransferase n=1 Tax=Bacillus testis TaxID=1622072 RepID=UPI00067F0026|nr:MBOAT family protein [Bacillus testis]